MHVNTLDKTACNSGQFSFKNDIHQEDIFKSGLYNLPRKNTISGQSSYLLIVLISRMMTMREIELVVETLDTFPRD